MNKTPVRVNGQVVETTIDLRQNEPYTLLTRKLQGDHSSTSDERVIELVLQVVNDETTPKTELVRTVKELRERVEQQREIIQQSVESNQVLSGAFEELSFMVIEQVLPQLEEKEVIDAKPIEDIAQPIEDEEELDE